MPFEIDVNMPRKLAPIAWLIGRWEGAGVAEHPTNGSYQFGQEVIVTHDDRPFLEWHSTTWKLDEQGNKLEAVDTEMGYWRPLGRTDGQDWVPGEPTPRGGIKTDVEFLIVRPEGILEMYYGIAQPAKIELSTDGVIRAPQTDEYKAGHRMYGYVQSNLMWAWDKTVGEQKLQASAELKRVA